MPPLSKTLRSETPEGYAAQEQLPPTSTPQGKKSGVNPFIRCPLPPFNATVDTLKQFDESGKIPARRVIPLPVAVSVGGSATIINNTTVNSSGGGSSSGNVPVVVAAKTVTISAPTLLPGDNFVTSINFAGVAVLMIVGASDSCEVRVYGDPTTQAADVARASDTAPAFEVTQGLVSNVVLDTPPLQFNWQNRLFVNQDVPVTKNLYVTVLNPTTSAVTPSVTITYLPLE